MNKNRNLDNEFLGLRPEDQAEHSFMGGMKLSARVRLFFLIWLGSATILAGLYAFADQRLFGAMDGVASAELFSRHVQLVETGIAKARGEEKTFLLKKDPLIAESFKINMESVVESLDVLSKMRQSISVRQHTATIRDGLAQYDQQFRKLVDSEKRLGLSDGSGMTRMLQDTSEILQAKFSTAGFANLAGQVSRINQEGQETLLSGYKRGVGEIQKRYQTLGIFLNETKIPGKNKKALMDLLKKHETILLGMINSRFTFEDEAQRFDDILTYLGPSSGALSLYAGGVRASAVTTLELSRKQVRIIIAAAAAMALLGVLLAGLVVIRSILSPLRQLAAVAGRMADGDRTVDIPGRGNSDATGTLARALDRWLDNLTDLDHLRQELDHTRARLETTLRQLEEETLDATQAARAALMSDEPEAAPAPEPASPEEESAVEQPVPSRPAPPRINAPPEMEGVALHQGGPISSVSRQLTSFSEYVTAAADDVERTEALMRGLGDATGQIEEMGALVMAIRDQTNLLAFRSPPKGVPGGGHQSGLGNDNVVVLSGEGREQGRDEQFPDADMAKRFDVIRDATERAERTTIGVRKTMAEVTRIAREIAATASAQAMEATSKLLSQSEYLQNMLDDVISRITPAEPGALSEEKASGKEDKDGNSPKKA
ncbi:MAG: HAMP domain-containing protein [Proteobacteria bacterium]|nr:HAMP domain-containing protein [Pseudomonadota bacterium]MDA1022290.1 HAMP domain-containing protein [Pseudomonadota bacterium]